MVLPPANYLVPVEGSDRRTYFCLGLQAADDGLGVLGNKDLGLCSMWNGRGLVSRRTDAQPE